MAARISEHHPLRRLFGALTEKSFVELLGWPDPNVTEYVSNLLVEFTHTDQLYQIRNERGNGSTRWWICCTNRKCCSRRSRSIESGKSIATSATSPCLWPVSFPSTCDG